MEEASVTAKAKGTTEKIIMEMKPSTIVWHQILTTQLVLAISQPVLTFNYISTSFICIF